jgi:uncharacterized membrane protein
MTATLLTILIWFCALGCALVGGLYFAFSTFIMTALERTGPAAGRAAMNSINTVILRSLFMPFFFGTTIGCLVLAIAGFIERRWWLVAGGVVYVLGMTVVTMIWNVPLNNALLRSEGDAGAEAWRRYLVEWTRWNHVRTVASVLSAAFFIAVLAGH